MSEPIVFVTRRGSSTGVLGAGRRFDDAQGAEFCEAIGKCLLTHTNPKRERGSPQSNSLAHASGW